MSFQPNGELIPSGGGDNIPLCRPVMTLGRLESCDVPLPFPNVSSRHCELSFQEGYWYIRDMGSTNGTKVNGVRLAANQKKVLRAGDEVTIAKRVYKISYTPPAGQRALDEVLEDEDIMSQGLLEKAGLENPLRRPPTRQRYDLNEYLREDEDNR